MIFRARPSPSIKCRRFLESIKKSHDTTSNRAHESTPFVLLLASNFDSLSKLLASASAPKLSKNCHKLSGLLAGKTKEIPDSLRAKDFEARQLLAGLLLLHETTKFSSSIASDIILKRSSRDRSIEHVETHVKSIERMNNSCSILTVQALITNAASLAKQQRFELQEKAVNDIKPYSVKSTLKEGSCFTVGLFDEESIRKAQDCYTNAPPSVHIHPPSFTRPFLTRGGPSGHFL